MEQSIFSRVWKTSNGRPVTVLTNFDAGFGSGTSEDVPRRSKRIPNRESPCIADEMLNRRSDEPKGKGEERALLILV